MSAISRFSLRGKSRDSYMDLIEAFPLASIRSEDRLKVALEVLDQLLPRVGADEGVDMYLEALSDLVAVYEEERHPIPPASDADLLRHLLEAKGATQAELCRATGIAKSTVSEVFGGKRTFSRPMIRKLAHYFQVAPSILAVNSVEGDPSGPDDGSG